MAKRLYELHDYSYGNDRMSSSSGSRVCFVEGIIRLDKPMTKELKDKYMSKPYACILRNEYGEEAIREGVTQIVWPKMSTREDGTIEVEKLFESGGSVADDFKAPMLDLFADLKEDFEVSGWCSVEDDFGGVLMFSPAFETATFTWPYPEGDKYYQPPKVQTFDEVYKERAELYAPNIPDPVAEPDEVSGDDKQYEE